MIEFSIIIPVFNSESCIQNTVQTIIEDIGKLNRTYEIILIDDGSSDGSWEVLKKIKASIENTTIIKLSKNFGQHPATVCGFKHAEGNFVLTMDDDLEVLPSEIEKLIDAQTRNDSDLVYGVYTRLSQSGFISFVKKIYKLISKIDGKQKGNGSSYRLLKLSLAKKIADNHKQFVFIDELCLWYTQKVLFIDVAANKNYLKKTRYKMGGLFSLAKTVIMFSSTFPLKLVTQIGLILSATNFILGVHYLVKKFYFKIEVAGYTSIIVSILFSTGLIIFCIGILAQYLSQALKAINNYPPYSEETIL
ncbi:MAG: glycosyltransferase [Bacteroidia bacterium]